MPVTGQAGGVSPRYHCQICGGLAEFRVEHLMGGIVAYLCGTHRGTAGWITGGQEPAVNKPPEPPRRPVTSRAALFQLHTVLCTYAFGVMAERNQSYSTEADALSNFREDGAGGIVNRMGDKRARLKNWSNIGRYPTGPEGFLNAIADTINYAVLMFAYVLESDSSHLEPINEMVKRNAELDAINPLRDDVR